VLLISFNSWPISLLHNAIGTGQRGDIECSKLASYAFIGYYRNVHETDMESLCWRSENGGYAPNTPRLALLFQASFFNTTHDIFEYDLMLLLRN